jgi:hypothetical protein
VGLSEYWSEAQTSGDGYGIYFNLPVEALPRGLHHIEYSISLSEQVTDGYDMDDDGNLDQYGPGQEFDGWVELDVR